MVTCPEETDVTSNMPALIEDTRPDPGDNSEHDSFQSDGADGTYFTYYEIPDSDRETGELGGDLVFFASLSCLSGYFTPTLSSEEEEHQAPTPTCSNCDRNPVSLGPHKCGFMDWCTICDESLWSTRDDWPPSPNAINRV